MTQEIVKAKPFMLITHSGLHIPLSENQQKALVEFRTKMNKIGSINATMTLDGTDVAVKDMREITTVEALEFAENRKKGQWQCKHGSWHARNEQCACKNPMYATPDEHPVIRDAYKNRRTREESLKVMIEAAVISKAAQIAKFGLTRWHQPLKFAINADHSKCSKELVMDVFGPESETKPLIRLCKGCGHEEILATTNRKMVYTKK